MPLRPPRLCGCGRIVPGGTQCPCRCKADAERKARFDRKRPSARSRGYDSEWQKARAIFLARPENHLCMCGCGRVADTLDHRIPHKGNEQLFWDQTNWQPMFHRCHSSKKQRQERRPVTP